ncbi:MAG: serine protease [Candidatus Poribacteria bacterium]|nr:serine protease [Candidatus Poribacteria bacterium]
MNNPIPVAQKALDSTVLLVTEDVNDKPLSFGSGFFIRDDLIVTNLHVVHGAKKCFAKLFGQKKMYEVKGCIAIDPENDLIVLKVENFDVPMTPVNLDNSIPVYIGETVYAVGSPRGYEGTISDGIISGIREDNKLIQMTAPISPGSSGGPVINSKGEVIGVSVESNNNAQNLNFAIPSIYVKKLIENVEEHTPRALLFAKLQD